MNIKILRSDVALEHGDSRGTVSLVVDWPLRPEELRAIEINITLPLGPKAQHVSLRDTRRLLEETARNSVNQAALQRWAEAQSAGTA